MAPADIRAGAEGRKNEELQSFIPSHTNHMNTSSRMGSTSLTVVPRV